MVPCGPIRHHHYLFSLSPLPLSSLSLLSLKPVERGGWRLERATVGWSIGMVGGQSGAVSWREAASWQPEQRGGRPTARQSHWAEQRGGRSSVAKPLGGAAVEQRGGANGRSGVVSGQSTAGAAAGKKRSSGASWAEQRGGAVGRRGRSRGGGRRGTRQRPAGAEQPIPASLTNGPPAAAAMELLPTMRQRKVMQAGARAVDRGGGVVGDEEGDPREDAAARCAAAGEVVGSDAGVGRSARMDMAIATAAVVAMGTGSRVIYKLVSWPRHAAAPPLRLALRSATAPPAVRRRRGAMMKKRNCVERRLAPRLLRSPPLCRPTPVAARPAPLGPTHRLLWLREREELFCV